VHGGPGDSAISGAEAPTLSYADNFNMFGNETQAQYISTQIADTVLTDYVLNKVPVETDFFHPFNPGNAAGFMPNSDPPHGNQGRGFKVADDTRGADFDPTSGDRAVSADGLKSMREYVGLRFPGLKNAPLLETRVCQYENSPDDHFIIDRHPVRENIWIVGGGSGHGFKHGPALGEMVARLVMEHEEANPLFRLTRFKTVVQ